VNTLMFYLSAYVGIGVIAIVLQWTLLFWFAKDKQELKEATKGLLLLSPFWPMIPFYLLYYNVRKKL